MPMSKLFISGDIAYRGRVGESLDSKGALALSEKISQAIRDADFSIANLESPVGSQSQFISKSGPSICCPEKLVSAIKAAGFSGVTLANNHFFDCGQSGVVQTIEACKKNGLAYYGGGVDRAEAGEVKTIQGSPFDIDIINVCEHEFSVASDTQGGSNGVDLVAIYNNIVTSLQQNHKAVVIVHGGPEYYQLPSPRMQKTYRFFIDVGALAVINCHQHCYGGYEVYKDRPIFYGLGNFYFDSSKRNSVWNQGYAVVLDLSEIISFKLIPYIQFDSEPGLCDLSEKEQVVFEQSIHELNDVISEPERLEKEWRRFARKKHLDRVLSPFYNRFTLKLYEKSWFPRLVPFRQRLLQLNSIQCESHRDILLFKMRESLKTKK